MLAQVADEAGDVVGDEAANGAGGVDADDDGAGGVEDEAGGLEIDGVGVDEGAGEAGDGGGVGAVADGVGELVLVDEGGGGVLVVDRQGSDADAVVGEGLAGALEGAQLGVAVGAPGAAVEQDDGEVVGQGESVVVGGGDGELGELVAGAEQGDGGVSLGGGGGRRRDRVVLSR